MVASPLLADQFDLEVREILEERQFGDADFDDIDVVRDDTLSDDVALGRQKKWLPLLISGIGAAAGVGNFVRSFRRRDDATGKDIPRNTVAVANRLASSITVSCQANDKKSGDKTLKSAEALMFSFDTSTTGMTNAWCKVTSGSKKKSFPAFGKGSPNWSTVLYNVLDSGIYVTNDTESQQGVLHRKW